MYQHPDDAITLGMQVFLPIPGQLAINRIAKHCKGSSLIKAIADSSYKNESIKKAAQQVIQPTADLITNAAQKTVASYATLVEEVHALYDKFPANKKFWKHAFRWDFDKKGVLQGFHTEHSYPGKMVKELSLPADKRGIYAGFYDEGEWRKFSTFFPKDLDRMEIRKKIEEAYANPIIKGQFSEIGQAKCGMQIKIVYKREGKNIVGLSAFPLY